MFNCLCSINRFRKYVIYLGIWPILKSLTSCDVMICLLSNLLNCTFVISVDVSKCSHKIVWNKVLSNWLMWWFSLRCWFDFQRTNNGCCCLIFLGLVLDLVYRMQTVEHKRQNNQICDWNMNWMNSTTTILLHFKLSSVIFVSFLMK